VNFSGCADWSKGVAKIQCEDCGYSYFRPFFKADKRLFGAVSRLIFTLLSDFFSLAAVFLASDDASYITSVHLLADGGMTSQLVSMQSFKSQAIEGSEQN
jgi:hypothetical protein